MSSLVCCSIVARQGEMVVQHHAHTYPCTPWTRNPKRTKESAHACTSRACISAKILSCS
jgi:hypothetical protein